MSGLMLNCCGGGCDCSSSHTSGYASVVQRENYPSEILSSSVQANDWFDYGEQQLTTSEFLRYIDYHTAPVENIQAAAMPHMWYGAHGNYKAYLKTIETKARDGENWPKDIFSIHNVDFMRPASYDAGAKELWGCMTDIMNPVNNSKVVDGWTHLCHPNDLTAKLGDALDQEWVTDSYAYRANNWPDNAELYLTPGLSMHGSGVAHNKEQRLLAQDPDRKYYDHERALLGYQWGYGSGLFESDATAMSTEQSIIDKWGSIDCTMSFEAKPGSIPGHSLSGNDISYGSNYDQSWSGTCYPTGIITCSNGHFPFMVREDQLQSGGSQVRFEMKLLYRSADIGYGNYNYVLYSRHLFIDGIEVPLWHEHLWRHWGQYSPQSWLTTAERQENWFRIAYPPDIVQGDYDPFDIDFQNDPNSCAYPVPAMCHETQFNGMHWSGNPVRSITNFQIFDMPTETVCNDVYKFGTGWRYERDGSYQRNYYQPAYPVQEHFQSQIADNNYGPAIRNLQVTFRNNLK